MPDDNQAERDRGIREIEKELKYDKDNIDIEHLVNFYKKHYSDQPVWRLAQDIQQQALLYYNIIEELKKCEFPAPSPGPPQLEEQRAEERFSRLEAKVADVRWKYEQGLRLVDPGTLPNPLADRAVETALKYLRKLSRGLLGLVRSSALILLEDVGVDPKLGGVELSVAFWPPGVTMTFVRSR